MLQSLDIPSQISKTTSMDMSSSYSGSTIFDPLSFDNISTFSALSSFDAPDPGTLEHFSNQQSDFNGIGKWADDGAFNNLFSKEVFLESNPCLDSLLCPY